MLGVAVDLYGADEAQTTNTIDRFLHNGSIITGMHNNLITGNYNT